MGIEVAVVEPGTVTLAGGPGCGEPIIVPIDEEMYAAASDIDHDTQYTHVTAKLNPESGERSYAIKVYQKKDLSQLRLELKPHLRRYDRGRRKRKHIKVFAEDLVAKVSVTNIIVLGLGSMSLVEADADSDGAEQSYDRLAWMLTFADILKRHSPHRHIRILAQDPTFAPPEQFFLWTLGVHVARDPDALDLVNENSMVVAFGGHGGCWSGIATRVWPGVILTGQEGVEDSTSRGEGLRDDDHREGEVVERVQDFFEAYDKVPPPIGLEKWGDMVLFLRKGEAPKKVLEDIEEGQATRLSEREGGRCSASGAEGAPVARWETVPV